MEKKRIKHATALARSSSVNCVCCVKQVRCCCTMRGMMCYCRSTVLPCFVHRGDHFMQTLFPYTLCRAHTPPPFNVQRPLRWAIWMNSCKNHLSINGMGPNPSPPTPPPLHPTMPPPPYRVTTVSRYARWSFLVDKETAETIKGNIC